MSNEKRRWVPEICYEDYENAELTNGLPFIQIPEDKEMPNVLFFFGSKETGEFQPGLDGEPEPIVEMELYQYACMKYLQESLTESEYDNVRLALGLLKLEEAREKGKQAAEEQAQAVLDKSKN